MLEWLPDMQHSRKYGCYLFLFSLTQTVERHSVVFPRYLLYTIMGTSYFSQCLQMAAFVCVYVVEDVRAKRLSLSAILPPCLPLTRCRRFHVAQFGGGDGM